MTAHLESSPHMPAATQKKTRSLVGARILVVEDLPEYRDLMRATFENQGAVVADAESANEALSVIEAVRPTVIVSDISLPGMDGYEFMRIVRSRTDSFGAHAFAVAVTALGRDEDRATALAAGFDAHVTKPFDASALVDMIAYPQRVPHA